MTFFGKRLRNARKAAKAWKELARKKDRQLRNLQAQHLVGWDVDSQKEIDRLKTRVVTAEGSVLGREWTDDDLDRFEAADQAYWDRVREKEGEDED